MRLDLYWALPFNWLWEQSGATRKYLQVLWLGMRAEQALRARDLSGREISVW